MARATASMDLAQSVKQWALDGGAALVGIASIDRFDPMPPYYDRAPQGHDPRDFFPATRSVISIAQPVLNAVMDAPAVLMDRMDAILLRDDPAMRDNCSVERVEKDIIYYDTPSHAYPERCNSRTTRVPNAPVRGDCTRICPLPSERKNLPERLQQVVAEWKGSDGTGR